MNPLLQVKLRFTGEKNNQKPGARNLRAKAETSTEKIDELIDSLRAVLRFYKDHPRITNDVMIDVWYNDIIAKSNRVRELLKPSRHSTNDTVVGARFSDAPAGEENHIITHYVDEKTIHKTIEELQIAKEFLRKRLGGTATPMNFAEPNSNIDYEGFSIGKGKLRDLIIDCSVVEKFDVPCVTSIPDRDKFLITFYKSELSLSLLLEKLRVDDTQLPYTAYGDDTISVTRDLFEIINDKIPYMISMISTDISSITLEDISPKSRDEHDIPTPQNEPVIGVIDTFFDESVYFSNWVDNKDYISDLEKYQNDLNLRDHGTEVTSIIVDDPRMNPWLDDGYGTSFAAPWISRKMCYLIDVMGMPREVAKALIIDSAAAWDYKTMSANNKSIMGYGVVPVDIRRIVETESDEIRFVVYGTSDSYRTANYAIPVPKDDDNKYPYIARATLCYFPECSRTQGVDYTDRELSLKFGRIMDDKGKISDINDNVQDDADSRMDERKSRKEFRKWDNTKFISQIVKNSNKPVKSYDDRLWGLSVTSKERLSTQMRAPLNFGVVVTLKEVNGMNRIEDFIKACILRGWIVNRIDVQNQLDIYASSQEEIHFE